MKNYIKEAFWRKSVIEYEELYDLIKQDLIAKNWNSLETAIDAKRYIKNFINKGVIGKIIIDEKKVILTTEQGEYYKLWNFNLPIIREA